MQSEKQRQRGRKCKRVSGDIDTNNNNNIIKDEILNFEQPKIPRKGLSECLEIQEPISEIFRWEVKGWSKISVTCIISKWFRVGDYNWHIGTYPKGYGRFKDKSMSIDIYTEKTQLPPNKELYVNYTLTLRDQLHGKHKSFSNHCKFSVERVSATKADFIPLEELNEPSRGFLVNDTCIMEADVTILGYSTSS